MQTFWRWAEALYQTDLRKLEGEPYTDVDWGPQSLSLTWQWKGYEILPHQKDYSKPNEFASLNLRLHRDMPGYFYVDGVDVAKPFRREGFATDLYNKALEVLQAAGYKGIVSYKSGRRPDADRLWDTLRSREDDEYDYLE